LKNEGIDKRRRAVVAGTLMAAAAGVTSPRASAREQGPPAGGIGRRSLRGQVALVTGAARGIGRAVAVRLAQEGADVAILDIADQIASVPYPMARPTDLAETKRLVEAEGRRALAIRADVRDRRQLDRAVAQTVERFEKLDILIPNAGILTFASLHEMSGPQWTDVIDVNLNGVARTIQAALPHMIGRKYGRIVVVNSCNSRFGSPQSASYNASKWGVLGLVKCAAVEYARQGITVNAVNPTGVRTPMIVNPATLKWADPENPTADAVERRNRAHLNAQDVGLIEPEEVAAAIPFLCSPDAGRITGEALDVAAGANVRWNS
jgi:SDR family mycofactocin-dependent oxidoreductase